MQTLEMARESESVTPATVQILTRTDRPSWLPQRPIRTGRTDGFSLQGCFCHGRGGPGMSLLCGCDLCLLQFCCVWGVPAACCYFKSSRHKFGSICACCVQGLRLEPKDENEVKCKSGTLTDAGGVTRCSLHRIC
jgi:hypothetical protein